MSFESESESWMTGAAERQRKNLAAFFERFALNRAAFEAFTLRRFPGGGVPYYVSTVPCGLAGPTSDIDVILVTDADQPDEAAASNMLFFEGWRAGVKVITKGEIGTALSRLSEAEARAESDVSVLDRLGMKFIDLERLVNGVAFSGPDAFLAQLPLLSRWALRHHRRTFHRAATMARLSFASGATRSGRAYGQEMTTAVMDGVMALCGRVQWNPKWTRERWAAFLASPLSARARAAADEVQVLRLGLRTFSEAELAAAVARVGQLLGGPNASVRQDWRLALAPEARVHPFLPGAVSISLGGRAAIVDSEVLDRILASGSDEVSSLSPSAARTAVELAQRGFAALAENTR